MNHQLIYDNKCYTEIGTIKIYIDSYEISGEKKFLFQPMAVSGIKFGELGRHPAILKITGKILKSDDSDPAVKLNTDMTDGVIYSLNINTINFTGVRLKKFKTLTDVNSQFISCELEFYCSKFTASQEGE